MADGPRRRRHPPVHLHPPLVALAHEELPRPVEGDVHRVVEVAGGVPEADVLAQAPVRGDAPTQDEHALLVDDHELVVAGQDGGGREGERAGGGAAHAQDLAGAPVEVEEADLGERRQGHENGLAVDVHVPEDQVARFLLGKTGGQVDRRPEPLRRGR